MELSLPEQIVARSLEVRRMGEYIGAFELVVWSFLEDVNVGLVVGGTVNNVREIFMPGLPALPGSAHSHYFVACNIGLDRRLMVVDTHGCHPRFGHYVIGAPLLGHVHASGLKIIITYTASHIQSNPVQ